MVGVSCNNNRNTHACIHIPPKKTHPRGHGPTLLASCCEASQRLKASVSCAIKKARSSSVCCGSRSRTGAEKPGLWGVGWLGGGLLVGGRGLRGVIVRVFGCVLYYSIICTSTLPPTDQPTTHREEKKRTAEDGGDGLGRDVVEVKGLLRLLQLQHLQKGWVGG